MVRDTSPLTLSISQLLKRKEKSGLPYPHNQTFWFLVNIINIQDTFLGNRSLRINFSTKAIKTSNLCCRKILNQAFGHT